MKSKTSRFFKEKHRLIYVEYFSKRTFKPFRLGALLCVSVLTIKTGKVEMSYKHHTSKMLDRKISDNRFTALESKKNHEYFYIFSDSSASAVMTHDFVPFA